MIYYPIQKRYGEETYDIREFVQPNSLPVIQVASSMDTSSKQNFVQSSWEWTHLNIRYPFYNDATIDFGDRHYAELYIKPTNSVKVLRNAFLSGTVSGLARLLITGTVVGGVATIVRDAIIGHGLYSVAMSVINGSHNTIIPALTYETLDFWNFPSETLRDGIGDCEDTAILLCSILRNMLSEDEVFVTGGLFKGFGHAWVTIINNVGEPIILETTGNNVVMVDTSLIENLPYEPIIRFNDKNVIEIRKDTNIVLSRMHKALEREKINLLTNYFCSKGLIS